MKTRHYAYVAASIAGAVGLAALSAIPGMRSIYIGYLGASVCICLPFIYLITAPDWWKSRAGRALMMLLGSLAALFALLMTSRLVADRTLREVLAYIVFSAVLVGGVRLAILFFQLRFGADWAKNRGDKQ